ncbi:nucleoside hydrolase [Ningiella sp. W23]|uniref:nucleoside hydrolase n=1 Tax=Ningiella sp. W23 TaxID=3023715 RepID=UPI0037568BD0
MEICKNGNAGKCKQSRVLIKGMSFWVALTLACSVMFASHALAATKLEFSTTIILDADTANEVDDLYAVVAALIEPSWDIKALNATHWQTSHWSSPTSMEDSHRLNQVLTGYLQMPVPTKRGGVARMYDWGDQAQHSAAAYEIIKQAHAMENGERLTVIALGALTNVASALFIDNSIADKISLFWLGTSYDFENNVLGTTDFNCIMDTQALHYLLNSTVPMTVIPVNVAYDMQFDLADTTKRIKGFHPLGDFLVDRWVDHMDGLRQSRAIWDLALIYGMMEPDWIETTTITTSKDFGAKEITYMSKIDGEQMYQAFFQRFKAHLSK